MQPVRGAEKILRRSFDKLRNLLRSRSLSLSKGRAMGGADAQVVGEGDDAAAAVAAHHAAGTVGVVELHGEIDLGVSAAENHEAVGLELLAEGFDAGDFPEGGEVAFAAVDDHEVVPRAGEFIKLCFHGFGS